MWCIYDVFYGNNISFKNNFQQFLTFPSDKVSATAEDLIRGLLTEQENRLDQEAIRAHGFFSDVDFDNIDKS